MSKRKQFTGGTVLGPKSIGEVSKTGLESCAGPEIFVAMVSRLVQLLCLACGNRRTEPISASLTTTNTSSVQANVRCKLVESPLTTELREFIDSVIVPILVKQFISERAEAEKVARECGGVAKSHDNTAALEY